MFLLFLLLVLPPAAAAARSALTFAELGVARALARARSAAARHGARQRQWAGSRAACSGSKAPGACGGKRILASKMRGLMLSRAMAGAATLLLLTGGAADATRTSARAAASATARAEVRRDSGGALQVRAVSGEFARDAVAWASFQDTLLETGWGVLDVQTNGAAEDNDQGFAAGLLEGWLTAKHIHSTAKNLAQEIFKNFSMPHDIGAFFEAQDKWAREMVRSSAHADAFFAQTGYLLRQYDGLVAGYNAAAAAGAAPAAGAWIFQLLNGVGDLFDIIPAVRKHARVDLLTMNKTLAELLHFKQSHCSALIKTTGNYDDIFVAHSSWYTFANTNRIMKHYDLNFRDPSTAATKVSFSSYPGYLESLDDFYMLSSGLTWTQTSNMMLDQSVYDKVVPQALLAWQRVRIASAMAHTGEEWYNTFRRHASGTYANQYLIVDTKLFRPQVRHVTLRCGAGVDAVVVRSGALLLRRDRCPTLLLV